MAGVSDKEIGKNIEDEKQQSLGDILSDPNWKLIKYGNLKKEREREKKKHIFSIKFFTLFYFTS